MKNISASSFFVIILTDLCVFNSWAPAVDVFPASFPYLPAFLSPLDSAPGSICQRLSPTVTGPCQFSYCPLCYPYLSSCDATQQLLRIIFYTFCKDCIKYPQYLAGYRHYKLHLFDRVLFPSPIIFMYLPEIRIFPNQRYLCLIQYISQAFPPTATDPAFSIVFARIICHDGISFQFLQLFGIVKTPDVLHFCNKYANCHFSNPHIYATSCLYMESSFSLDVYTSMSFNRFFQLHPCRPFASDAMLRYGCQGLRHLHSKASKFRISPYLVHAFHSEFSDVLWQRRRLEHHPPADCF